MAETTRTRRRLAAFQVMAAFLAWGRADGALPGAGAAVVGGRFAYDAAAISREQEAAGIERAAGGEFLLARLGGRFVSAGVVTWRAERPDDAFDAVVLEAEVVEPAGSAAIFEVRSVDAATGRDTEWTRVERGAATSLPGRADTLQLRLRLSSRSSHVTPRVRGIGLTCVRSERAVLAGSAPRLRPLRRAAKGRAHDERIMEALTLSPFDRMGTMTAEGVSFGAGGEVTLSAGDGPRAGVWVSKVHRPGPLFDTLQVGYRARVPRGCTLKVSLCTFAHATELPGEWRAIAPEGEALLGVVSDAFQLRVELTSPDGKTLPALCAASVQYGLGGEAPEVPGAVIAVVPPEIVERGGWGASGSRESYEASQPGKVTLHHTWAPRASLWRGAASVRGIQEFHMANRGWNDIAYHYLVAPDGTIYRGRPEGANGSHSPPNRRKLGVCVVGDFNKGEERLSPGARDSLVKLLAYLAGKYGISSRSIYGHRDFNRTDCPGDSLYGSIVGLRDAVESVLRKAAADQARRVGAARQSGSVARL